MAIQLTPEQKAVIENRGRSLLVSAAAGSGMTDYDIAFQLIGKTLNLFKIRPVALPEPGIGQIEIMREMW